MSYQYGNPILEMWLDNLYRQQQYAQFNASLPPHLRVTANMGQAQADQARSDYMKKTLNPMIAEASTSQLNGGQNSTFAAGRVAALQIAGAAEASRLSEQARQGAINDIMQQREAYLGAPIGGGAGYGGYRSPTSRQTEAPGSSWLDRLPAYAQLAYGVTNAARSPVFRPIVKGAADFVTGMGSRLGGMFHPQATSANPASGSWNAQPNYSMSGYSGYGFEDQQGF
jgi:hypothetical protein